MAKRYIIVLFLLTSCTWLTGQAIQPDSISVRIAEATLSTCGDISDIEAEEICFDIFLSIEEKGWTLYSYNIWIDFGANDSIISHLSDKSCFQRDAGDTDIGKLGKYRLIAGQAPLDMEPKKEYLIHHLFFRINDFEGIEGLQLIAGGDVYGLLSSVNLVDQNDTKNSCNPVLPAGEPLILTKME